MLTIQATRSLGAATAVHVAPLLMSTSLFSSLWTIPPLAPPIPSFCTRCRWVINLTSRPFEPLGTNLRHQPSRRLGGPHSWWNILENGFSCPCWEVCMWLWNLFCGSFRYILIAFLPRYFLMITVRINSRVLFLRENCLQYQQNQRISRYYALGTFNFFRKSTSLANMFPPFPSALVMPLYILTVD